MKQLIDFEQAVKLDNTNIKIPSKEWVQVNISGDCIPVPNIGELIEWLKEKCSFENGGSIMSRKRISWCILADEPIDALVELAIKIKEE